MDQETRANEKDHDTLRVWLRLLTCSKLIEAEVRRALAAEFDCTLPRFDLLAQLYREREGLTMGAVSRRLMVTGGNVTGIADQLEKEGLLIRDTAPEDRRQIQIQLTEKGKREFARMAGVHEGWIVRLFAGVPEPELHRLHELLGVLKASIQEQTR